MNRPKLGMECMVNGRKAMVVEQRGMTMPNGTLFGVPAGEDWFVVKFEDGTEDEVEAEDIKPLSGTP